MQMFLSQSQRNSFQRLSRLLISLPVLVGICIFSLCDSVAARTLRWPLKPLAVGSMPSRLFRDGTVCLVDEGKPSVCRSRLGKIDRRIMQSHSFTFYGVFNLESDGSPEVFIDYWSPSLRQGEDDVTLLVYKKLRGKYRKYLKLKAQSLGYAPGAWFLKEKPHPKAIFMTRYGGSSGTGLFYLNLKNKSLDLISGGVFLEGQPVFEDLDGDGIAEIFLPGRGRDRTSEMGGAILHWSDEGYKLWWPNWPSLPYVIYAKLVDLDKDGRKEIVAVLDPTGASPEDEFHGRTARRELGVWKVENGNPVLSSKTELPNSAYLGEPKFAGGKGIDLSYTRIVKCENREDKIICHDEIDDPKRAVENQANHDAEGQALK